MTSMKKTARAVAFGKKFAKSRRSRLRAMASAKSVTTRNLNAFSASHKHPLLTHLDDEHWRERVLAASVPKKVQKEKTTDWLAHARAPLIRANATLIVNSVREIIRNNEQFLNNCSGNKDKKKPLVVVALDTGNSAVESAFQDCAKPGVGSNNHLSKLFLFENDFPLVVTKLLTVVDCPEAQSLVKRKADNADLLLDRNNIHTGVIQAIEEQLEQTVGPQLGILIKTVMLHDGSWNMGQANDIVSATYAEARDIVASRVPGSGGCKTVIHMCGKCFSVDEDDDACDKE